MTSSTIVLRPPVGGLDKDGNPIVDEDGNELVPVYSDPGEFFRHYLAPLFARDIGKSSPHAWCVVWEEHMEATIVIEALWRSWEDCTLDPGRGLAHWLVMYGYPLMRELFARAGTFDGCSELMHDPRAKPLP